MASWVAAATLTFVYALLTCSEAGIYLPKRVYTFYIPRTISPGGTIGVVDVLESYVMKCDVSQTVVVQAGLEDYLTSSIDDHKILVKVRSISDAFILTNSISLTLTLECQNKSVVDEAIYRPLTSTSLVLQTDTDPGQLASGQSWDAVTVQSEFCPKPEDLKYDIIENSQTGSFDILDDIRLRNAPSGVAIRLLGGCDSCTNITFNPNTRELVLLTSPDREVKDLLQYYVTCSVTLPGQDAINTTTLLEVKVHDVDDNPPVQFKNKALQIQFHDVKLKDGHKSVNTFDYDSIDITNADAYRIHTTDTAGVVVLGEVKFMSRRPNSFISAAYSLVEKDVEWPYTADIVVDNVKYQPSGNTSMENRMIHRLKIDRRNVKTINLDKMDLDYNAAKYSWVLELPNVTLQDSKTFNYSITKVVPPYLANILAVTPSGVVYVSATEKLSNSSNDLALTALVRKKVDGSTTEEINITLQLMYSRKPKAPRPCDDGCSIHNTKEKCEKSCGFGAFDGECKWRQGDMNMSVTYSTCSPDLTTCPDGFCSDLEMMDFFICPQDCTTEKIGGQVFRKNNSRQGIYRAKGPCWCEVDNKQCTCEPEGGQKANLKGDDASGDDDVGCSPSCKTGIAVSLTILLLVAVACGLGWVAWRRRGVRPPVTLKHVNSLVSMAAVPSDYIVDDPRDQRSHGNRLTSSPASGQCPAKIGLGQDVFEDKWEFPRCYLTIEHVIGEGEFGQVVRAQAFMLNGQEGNTVVAVKMLKPDASGAEYQDLVSEFQLLKEVDHPNVIKLLGVCTQKGPLYVIVEYCELGSLRSFLRGAKLRNRGRSWEDKQRCGNDTVGTEPASTRTLTFRDLLSFAWQIAKGMDYLAGLKIVHRDLAARNVLVTEGLKMKISDFGLSRDVYEADTYLKMSKGRMPVKWMAPESLYAQIYTMKSDIWSYGIVLWEIVTLGASPYPGIPPERLFPLLSTGYRMDRPEDCPEELYAIMQKCWKTEPENRPHFSMLRDILDHLLQQNTEYLELSNDNYFSSNSACDSDERRRDNPPHYGNVCCVSQCPPDAYVTTHWPGEELGDGECPELSKLLVQNETEMVTEDSLNNKHFKDGHKRTGRLLVHENLTYV